MNPPTHTELFALEHDLAAGKTVDITRLREIIWLYGELRKQYSELAECHLAGQERLNDRKSTPKCDVTRMASITDKYVKPTIRHQGLGLEREPSSRGNPRVMALACEIAPKTPT